jgi:hypothetical protein
MKTLQFAIIIGLMFAGLTACKKDCNHEPKTLTGDGMIFGRYYGECGGEGCIEMFKIENGKVYEDTEDNYPYNQLYSGTYVELDASAYNKVSYMLNAVPTQLYSETDTTIGIPDGGDWGGIYLEVKSGNTHRYWFIDHMTTNLPPYLVPFVSNVDSAITLLQ